jgi:hypothetical protein
MHRSEVRMCSSNKLALPSRSLTYRLLPNAQIKAGLNLFKENKPQNLPFHQKWWMKIVKNLTNLYTVQSIVTGHLISLSTSKIDFHNRRSKYREFHGYMSISIKCILDPLLIKIKHLLEVVFLVIYCNQDMKVFFLPFQFRKRNTDMMELLNLNQRYFCSKPFSLLM